jgi:hypothetical protein
MKCSCGNEVLKDARYCSECGVVLPSMLIGSAGTKLIYPYNKTLDYAGIVGKQQKLIESLGFVHTHENPIWVYPKYVNDTIKKGGGFWDCVKGTRVGISSCIAEVFLPSKPQLISGVTVDSKEEIIVKYSIYGNSFDAAETIARGLLQLGFDVKLVAGTYLGSEEWYYDLGQHRFRKAEYISMI